MALRHGANWVERSDGRVLKVGGKVASHLFGGEGIITSVDQGNLSTIRVTVSFKHRGGVPGPELDKNKEAVFYPEDLVPR